MAVGVPLCVSASVGGRASGFGCVPAGEAPCAPPGTSARARMRPVASFSARIRMRERPSTVTSTPRAPFTGSSCQPSASIRGFAGWAGPALGLPGPVGRVVVAGLACEAAVRMAATSSEIAAVRRAPTHVLMAIRLHDK